MPRLFKDFLAIPVPYDLIFYAFLWRTCIIPVVLLFLTVSWTLELDSPLWTKILISSGMFLFPFFTNEG